MGNHPGYSLAVTELMEKIQARYTINITTLGQAKAAELARAELLTLSGNLRKILTDSKSSIFVEISRRRLGEGGKLIPQVVADRVILAIKEVSQ